VDTEGIDKALEVEIPLATDVVRVVGRVEEIGGCNVHCRCMYNSITEERQGCDVPSPRVLYSNRQMLPLVQDDTVSLVLHQRVVIQIVHE
jgi:hypothetical protein